MARPIAARRGQVVWIGAELSAAVGGAEGAEVTRRVQAIVRRAVLGDRHPDGSQDPVYPDDRAPER
jgi:hypothetical protein